MLDSKRINPLAFLLLLGLSLLIGPGPGLAQAQQQKAQAQQGAQQQTAPAAQQAAAPAAQPQSQSPLPPDLAAPVERLTKGIEQAEKAVQQLKELEEELGRLRVDVEGILTESKDKAEELRPRASAIKDQIEKLGPPPAKDAPPESAEIAAERARLNAEAAAVESAIKATELTWVRARQLIVRITELRYSLFTRNLLERQASPLLPDIWRRVSNDAPPVGRRLSYLATDWMSWARQQQQALGLLLVGALITYLLARYVARRATRRPPRDPAPGFVERAVSAAWVAPVRIVPALLAGLVIYAGLDGLDLLYQPWEGLGAGLAKGLLVFVSVGTLLATVFAVREPSWRLFDLSTRSARRVCRILQTLTAVYAIDLALTEMARAFFIPLGLSIVQSLITSLLFVLLLVLLLLTPFQPASSPPEIARPRHEPRWLKLPLWILAAAILAAALTGYMALSRFVAQQIVTSGLVVFITGLLYLAIRSLTREPASPDHPIGQLLERRFGLDYPRRHQLSRLIEICLALVLGLCALPVMMLQWGFSGAEIRDWFRQLFFGLEIGQFRISIARILLGLVLFTALLLATRLFQRWLRDRVLQQPRIDPGIANSIDTVVGYVGIFLAALIAVSYAGLDITNFAIVAGALSVGIGFGLQSIVNNFVSGLILLIERPIKVGDWIVVGNEQGNVRRISVRATEIETFDRASLIVPNSELITGRVLNWTHRNLLGRVVLKIGVDYTADPDKVMQVLLKCAEDHPLILKTPEPKAVFEGFGANSLEFSLRFLLGDLNRSVDVQSQMRIEILRALRAAGIDIPHTQPPAQPVPQDIVLHIGVAYATDPDRVIQILRRCADAHPAVVASPAPKAVFEGVGPSSLDFSLRATIDDPDKSLDVQSELRIAILKAFRAEGIEIPYAQHDVHLRDLDGLRALINRAAEQRRASEGDQAEKPQTAPATPLRNG